jgi:hypothetical protein
MAGNKNKATEEEVEVKKYRVTNRLLSWRGDGGKEVHAQEGEIVTVADVPKAALAWYLSEGHMVEVGSPAEAAYKERVAIERLATSLTANVGEEGSDDSSDAN